MPEAYRHCVTGRVQGVGFRAATCDKARELGLSGWVGNLAGGSVEVVAGGSASALESLHDWLEHGPPGAHVDDHQVEAVTDSNLDASFSIR